MLFPSKKDIVLAGVWNAFAKINQYNLGDMTKLENPAKESLSATFLGRVDYLHHFPFLYITISF